MKGILKEIKKIECKTKEGKKFSLVEFKCDVKINDKGEIKTLRGSYGEEFAKKYFTFCGVKTKDLVGKTVDVVIGKRTYTNDEGEERTVNFIKYLNVLDEEGNPIRLPKDDETELDF